MPTFSASLLPRVQKTPGVKLAAGAIFTPGGFFDAEGDKIGTKFAPKFISSTLPDEPRVAHLRRRAPPARPDRSLDRQGGGRSLRARSSANRSSSIGQGSAAPFRLVGFTQLGSASFGGASIAQVTLPVAQRLTHKRGRFDQISVAADEGVSATALKRRIARVMPPRAGSRPRRKTPTAAPKKSATTSASCRPSCSSSASSPSSSAPS